MKLYNGDCLEIMKNIADNSVDMIKQTTEIIKVLKS